MFGGDPKNDNNINFNFTVINNFSRYKIIQFDTHKKIVYNNKKFQIFTSSWTCKKMVLREDFFMEYLYIYYYDSSDNLHRVQCEKIIFDDGVARFRDQNNKLIQINATQIDCIKTY